MNVIAGPELYCIASPIPALKKILVVSEASATKYGLNDFVKAFFQSDKKRFFVPRTGPVRKQKIDNAQITTGARCDEWLPHIAVQIGSVGYEVLDHGHVFATNGDS